MNKNTFYILLALAAAIFILAPLPGRAQTQFVPYNDSGYYSPQSYYQPTYSQFIPPYPVPPRSYDMVGALVQEQLNLVNSLRFYPPQRIFFVPYSYGAWFNPYWY